MNQPKKHQKRIYSKYSTLAFKKYKINLTVWSFLKSAATEGVPSLLQSRIHPCAGEATRGCPLCESWCAQAAALCSQPPQQIPAQHQRVSCWPVQNDTIHFYPGCYYTSCRISPFLHGPRSKGEHQQIPARR